MRNYINFLIFICLSGGSTVAVAQADPLGGATLGVGMKIMGDQVKEILEKAVGGGLMLEIQAGGQIGVLIQQANVAYQSDLDLTYGRLNAAERQTVDNLRSLVNDYSKQIYNQAKDITDRAQTIANTLPFSKTFPQLMKFAPTYAVYLPDHAVTLSLTGNFVDVARDNNDASVTINGSTYKNTAKTTQQLSFDIPGKILKSNPGAMASNHVDIDIPYEDSYLLFLSTKKEAHFSVPLVLLPKHLGTLTFRTNLTKPSVERQNFATTEIQQDSADDDIKCGGEHGDLAVHSVSPDPGWTVIPSSVTWKKLWTQGSEGSGADFWLDRNCSTLTAACLCISTEHHRVGSSGKVHFQIVYTAERPITVDDPKDQTIDLGWSEQKTFEVPVGGTWKAALTQFDGKTLEFATAMSNTFMNVSVIGNVVSIATIP